MNFSEVLRSSELDEDGGGCAYTLGVGIEDDPIPVTKVIKKKIDKINFEFRVSLKSLFDFLISCGSDDANRSQLYLADRTFSDIEANSGHFIPEEQAQFVIE